MNVPRSILAELIHSTGVFGEDACRALFTAALAKGTTNYVPISCPCHDQVEKMIENELFR
jgi:hypothetical protein